MPTPEPINTQTNGNDGFKFGVNEQNKDSDNLDTTSSSGQKTEEKSGWFSNALKRFTDGINRTFDGSGDDDEI